MRGRVKPCDDLHDALAEHDDAAEKSERGNDQPLRHPAKSDDRPDDRQTVANGHEVVTRQAVEKLSCLFRQMRKTRLVVFGLLSHRRSLSIHRMGKIVIVISRMLAAIFVTLSLAGGLVLRFQPLDQHRDDGGDDPSSP